MGAVLRSANQPEETARIRGEQRSQRVVTAFVMSGLVFMLLPGTFLGVWNLLDISEGHRPEAVPQAWLQAHGQAQIFGWIGSFILGIGFYSLTKMKSTKAFPALAGWVAWSLWTVGVLLRWLGGVTGDDWRVLLPVSAVLQLAGFLAFYVSVRRYSPSSSGTKDKAWLLLVAFATVAFMVALVVNGWLLFEQAMHGASAALPHVTDQQFVVLAVWGVLVPTIWGFNARWLPVFLGLRAPNQKSLYVAYILSVAGVVVTFTEYLAVAEAAFLLAAILAIDALHVWASPVHPPKVLNVHRGFPAFVRLAYAWLLVSCVLAMIAVRWDTSGGIWGASRHALTVGFVAMMVFAIGQRVLPAFCGMHVLYSTRMMGWSLYLLFAGCLLRVFAEPLAYENVWALTWKILPVSAVMELTAVSLFAINLAVTILRPQATHG